MQEPADDVLGAPSIDTVVEVSLDAVVLDQATIPEAAQALEASEAPGPDEPLNRAERIAADFGAWVVTAAMRWHLQGSPCFVADGRSLCDVEESVPSPAQDTPKPIIH